MLKTSTLFFQPPPIQVELALGKNLFNEALIFTQTLGKTVFILTTQEVASLLTPVKEPICILPSGESIKSRANKEKIEEFLLQHGAGKSASLLAVGGGSLLDLVGFAASTYCRGIPFVSMPTTLLAMTDAALGGKTGLNVKQAKNWIGTFYHPKKIFMDLNYLYSLPQKEYFFGLSETVKHALVADRLFFELIEKNWASLVERDPKFLGDIIWRSALIKKEIVEKDPFEIFGLRHLLNFGHTVGHALESFFSYKMHHGEAVYLGMFVETSLSFVKGYLNQKEYAKLKSFFNSLALSWPEKIPFARMKWDKKGACHFVPLQEIGKGANCFEKYLSPFNQEEFEHAWKLSCSCS